MTSVKHAVEMMKFSHGMLDTMLKGIPDDKAAFQLHPTSNHVLWTLGHLACTYAWFATTIDAKAAEGSGPHCLPEAFGKQFGMGSKPSGDASVYPPLAEMRRKYDESFAAYLKMVEGLTEADAWGPCASDTGGFASSKLDAAYKCAWHDGWHLGQIADLRRALGLPSVM